VAAPTVLHVLEALGGGTSRHLIDVVSHTPDVRHEVAVPRRRVGWLSDDSAVERLGEAGARVHLVEMRRYPLHPRNAIALGAVRRLLASRRPDIVHGHSAVGGVLARVAALGQPAPVVYTPNGLHPGRLALAVERRLGRVTDRLLAVSESEGRLAVDLGIVPSQRLVIIPNGIDLEQLVEPFDLRERLGLGPRVPLVGTLGRLVPQKAPQDFIRACRLIADVRADAHFVQIGTGVLLPEVERAVVDAGLAARFHRMDDFDAAAGVLGQLDVYVLASRYEGGPYTPLEAMRAGSPVVLTDVVGSRDVLVDGESGLLVPPADPPAMARAVLALLEDAGARRRLAAGGRQRLEERFDVRAMGAALAKLYAELAGRD
jgi:glycosyltransferase involved in cell wall biosynthesis